MCNSQIKWMFKYKLKTYFFTKQKFQFVNHFLATPDEVRLVKILKTYFALI